MALPLAKQDLLDRLGEILHGKSVEKTLTRMQQHKTVNQWEDAKGLCSLMTHVCIEMEKGNMEYLPILKELYQAVGVVITSERN